MFGKCDVCGKFRFSIKRHDVMTGPGSGHEYAVCDNCPVPKSFNEKYGISGYRKPDARFIRFVGTPGITESRYGENAYGSVLAEYDDGSRTPVICGHGGSAWFCLDCAIKTIAEQKGA